ncbi:hypothetical protein F1880_004639, partial [Penicillium rolfsii]
LNDLLGKIKASLKNDTAELEWNEDRVRALRARQQKREIADTLNKLYDNHTYIYIFKPLTPRRFLQSLTRRAKARAYLGRTNAIEFNRQIDYLLFILQPFFKYTTVVCTTKDISIHLVFSFYNKLFDHLENSIRQLRRKKLILSSLEAAQEKLLKYYAITDRIEGDLYAIKKDYKRIYYSSLKSLFTSYEEKRPEERLQSDAILLITTITDADLLFKSLYASLPPQQNELTRYLKSHYKHEFPVLASLARDIMSIPATRAGVERLFNSARDICYYRRGSLKPKTIRDIML